jgi:putrescine transport system substrate-binding protein
MNSLKPVFPAIARTVATLLAAALMPVAPAAASAGGDANTLNVYNWSDYIAPDTVPNFQRSTGIKVNYDTYDANETLHAKLVAGHTDYDIVVPATNWAQLQIAGGLLRKLDKDQIPNLKNLDPAIMARIAKADPGNQYLVPWAWGVTTIGINVDKVKAALGGMPMPADPFDLLFKVEYVSKLKSCGVSVLDSADDVFPAALNYLGYKTDSGAVSEYNEAAQLLNRIRPSIGLFSSSGYIDDLANGSLCLVLGWSGDFTIAKHRAIESKTRQNIQMLLSDKGGELWYSVMAVPADAPHPQNAMKWINFVLDGPVHASLTNMLYYPSGNLASLPFVRPEIRDEISIPGSMLARFKLSAALSNETRRLRQRLYVKFKTGV